LFSTNFILSRKENDSDGSASGSLVLRQRQGGAAQFWRLEGKMLVSKTGLVAAVMQGLVQEGASVVAAAPTYGAQQQWK
jgi:hypothetical protein